MRFVPDYQLPIIEDEAFPSAIRDVTDKLDAVRVSGTFHAFDGVRLYYEYFLAENSRGSIVIVHGLSEFTKKFYEFAYYALHQGYNVFVYDQRCHGLSDRLTDNPDVLHVGNFRDYVKDLAQFVDEIVLPADDKPLYLYAHSMGGAVSALYLAKYGDKIQKAVLSAPMFEPIVDNVPVPIARAGVFLGQYVCGCKRKFKLTAEFNPNVPYTASQGSSRVRFEHFLSLRRDNKAYQSSPMSFGWVSHSLTVGRHILSRRVAGRITTPTLIVSAEKDTMVNNHMQYRFSERCDACELVSIPNAAHALLASDAPMLTRLLTLTFDFWKQ